jgi:hypothetical protein
LIKHIFLKDKNSFLKVLSFWLTLILTCLVVTVAPIPVCPRLNPRSWHDDESKYTKNYEHYLVLTFIILKMVFILQWKTVQKYAPAPWSAI